jgi:hypothetical protein
VSFGVPALVAAEPGEAHGRAQFPELGSLLLRDAWGIAIQFLSGLGMPLPQQRLAFVPIELGREPAQPCPFDDLQSIVQLDHGLFYLPCGLVCPGEEGDKIKQPRPRPGGAVSDQTAARSDILSATALFLTLTQPR